MKKEPTTLKEKFFQEYANISDENFKLEMLYRQNVIMKLSVENRNNTNTIKGIAIFYLVCSVLSAIAYVLIFL